MILDAFSIGSKVSSYLFLAFKAVAWLEAGAQLCVDKWSIGLMRRHLFVC